MVILPKAFNYLCFSYNSLISIVFMQGNASQPLILNVLDEVIAHSRNIRQTLATRASAVTPEKVTNTANATCDKNFFSFVFI